MTPIDLFVRQWRIGVAYFVAASLTIAFTRSAGGLAALWIATGVLVGILVHQPRGRWGPILLSAGLGSALATSVFGFGPALAVPFAIINMAEAWIGAYVFRRIGKRVREPFKSPLWVLRIFASVGLAAPVACAGPAALLAVANGQDLALSLLLYVTGHSLGSVTVTPLAMLVANRKSRREARDSFRRHWARKLSLLGLVAATVTAVFSQNNLPLLFLPALPMILVTFHSGREIAALSVVLLALIGGTLTMTGHGPIFLMDSSPLGRMLFFQFFLAITVLTILPVAADLHSKRRVLRAVADSEERFRLIAEHSTDVLLQIDTEGRVLYVSPSIRTLGGYDPAALVGRHITALIAPDSQEHVIEQHGRALLDPTSTHSFEYLAVLSGGGMRWFESHARAVIGEDGQVEGSLSIIRDVQARKEMEQRLTQAAFTDSLTGLPNRRAFRERAERRRIDGAGPDCIAIFDIDHFKRVNDLFGHDIGDLVLQHFAAVARSMLREGDFLARFGGEEFVVLMSNTSTQEALGVCERLRREIALTPLCAQHQVVRLTVSGGVSALGIQGLDAALKVADLALYQAKEGGRDQLLLAA